MGARVPTGLTSQLTPLDANDSHLHLHTYALFLDENDSHLHLHIYALIIHWSEQ
jgi:hypothetical protein